MNLKQLKRKIKGYVGEKRVRKQLAKLSAKDYTVFNDIIFNGKNGSIQIDHLVVSRFGVFVIETKNYSGILHGNNSDYYWKQNINGYVNDIYSPIKQNEKHVRELCSAIGFIDRKSYMPIIAFTRASNPMVWGSVPVIFTDEITQTILQKQKILLNEDQVSGCVTKVTMLNVDSPKNREIHRQYVDSVIKKNRAKS